MRWEFSLCTPVPNLDDIRVLLCVYSQLGRAPAALPQKHRSCSSRPAAWTVPAPLLKRCLSMLHHGHCDELQAFLYLLKIYLVRLRKLPVSSSSDAGSFETCMRVSFTAFSLSIKMIMASAFVNVQTSSSFQIEPRRVNTAHLVGLLVGGAELRAAVATRRDCTGGRARGAHHAAGLLASGWPWCPAPCSLGLTQREWPVRAEAHGPASAVTRCPQLMFGVCFFKSPSLF